MARAECPDVVVMDLHMPTISGVEATRRISEDDRHVGVLVLTMFDDDDSVFAAMRAGARGYLLKGATTPTSSARSPRSPPAKPSSTPWWPDGSSSSSRRRGRRSPRPFPS